MSNNKVLKAGLGYTLGNIIIKGISFLTLPLFTRLLTTEDFGIYNLYGTYETIVAILIGVGMYSSIKNAVYDFPNQKRNYIATIVTITLGMSVLFFALIFILGGVLEGITGLNRVILLLLVCHAFGDAMLQIVNSKLATEYDCKSYLGYAGVNTLGNIILSLLFILVIFPLNHSLGRIAGASTTIMCIGLYILINVYRDSGHPIFNLRMAKYGIKFGIPLIFHYLAQQIASQFDRIMISKMMDNSAVGLYSFAYTIANIFPIIFYSTDSVWSVWLFEKLKNDDYDSIRKTSNYYIFAMLCVAVSMMIGANEIIHLMGSQSYWQSSEICIPLIFGLFFLFLYTLPVAIEYYYKQTKYIAGMTIVSAVVNVVGNYYLILLFGYNGAAYSTAISYCVLFIGHWFIARHIIKKEGKVFAYKMTDIMVYVVVLALISVVVFFLNSIPIIKYSIFAGMIIILIIVFRDKLISIVKSYKKSI